MTWAVKFEGVSKRYRGGGPRYGSLRHDLSQGLKGLGRMFSARSRAPGGKLALDDVSFEVRQGESFAIIGPNGAGKTTALKLISRISYPTAGRILVRGRVGALIEVGSGVHPELTGRENIWLYGQILGMSRVDVRRRFEEIVEFSELGHVLDLPVKQYSSGMQLRLGFSIASHLKPDVFVVDEALAVGDAAFQTKCATRMRKLLSEGRTILFVSHNLSAVKEVCSRGVLLVRGRIHFLGPIGDVLRTYLDEVNTNELTWRESESARRQTIEIRKVSCHASSGMESYVLSTGDDLELRLSCRAVTKVLRPDVSIGISDGRTGMLILCSTLVDGGAPESLEGDFVVRCVLRDLPLLPHVYQVWCVIHGADPRGDVLEWGPVASFQVAGSPTASLSQAPSLGQAPIYVARTWHVHPLSESPKEALGHEDRCR